MECSCNISIDHDGGADCCHEKIRKARKRHRCCECYRDILPGEYYEYVSGIWDGTPDDYKTCLDCKSVKDAFFDSYIFTNLWEDFYESMSECGWQVPEKCLSKLTPAARARVCESIENYWDDGEDEE